MVVVLLVCTQQLSCNAEGTCCCCTTIHGEPKVIPGATSCEAAHPTPGQPAFKVPSRHLPLAAAGLCHLLPHSLRGSCWRSVDLTMPCDSLEDCAVVSAVASSSLLTDVPWTQIWKLLQCKDMHPRPTPRPWTPSTPHQPFNRCHWPVYVRVGMLPGLMPTYCGYVLRQAPVKGAGALRSSACHRTHPAGRSQICAHHRCLLPASLPHKLLYIGGIQVQALKHQVGSVEAPAQHTNGLSPVQYRSTEPSLCCALHSKDSCLIAVSHYSVRCVML